LGQDFSFFRALGLVWSTIARVLKIRKDDVNAFKAQLDKFWLHQAVKFDFTADLRSDLYRKPIKGNKK